MRKPLFAIGLLLILMMLACNVSRPAPATPTREGKAPPPLTGPTDTPAPGTSTPTAAPATTEPTGDDATATPTLYPMCTPPACAEGEVYYCPDECPGGCGTQCATPTPAAVTGAPVIQAFTAQPATIVQDEGVQVTWQATGGESAVINWMGSGGLMDGLGDLAPGSGSVVIEPHDGPVVLQVTNAHGSTTAQLNLTIQCRHAWASELAANPPGRCPGELTNTWAAYQPFQNGFMIWLESEQAIYVFYNTYGGRAYRIYPDNFQEGDPESDPGLTPPSGLQQPVRGFGLVWRSNAEVRDNLGWATGSEIGFESWLQSYRGMGMHNITHYTHNPYGTVYALSPMGQVWRPYP